MTRRTTFADLQRVMARLRSPRGCPWDREQTHASLLRYLREEAAEMEAAVQSGDRDNLCEELGDVLFQVLFHARIAEERGDFDITDVLAILKHKLVNRHPHVFGTGRKEKLTAEDVKNRWDELKAREKATRPPLRARRRPSAAKRKKR